MSTMAHVFEERISLDSMLMSSWGIDVMLCSTCSFSKGNYDGEKLMYLVMDKLTLAIVRMRNLSGVSSTKLVRESIKIYTSEVANISFL